MSACSSPFDIDSIDGQGDEDMQDFKDSFECMKDLEELEKLYDLHGEERMQKTKRVRHKHNFKYQRLSWHDYTTNKNTARDFVALHTVNLHWFNRIVSALRPMLESSKRLYARDICTEIRVAAFMRFMAGERVAGIRSDFGISEHRFMT